MRDKPERRIVPGGGHGPISKMIGCEHCKTTHEPQFPSCCQKAEDYSDERVLELSLELGSLGSRFEAKEKECDEMKMRLEASELESAGAQGLLIARTIERDDLRAQLAQHDSLCNPSAIRRAEKSEAHVRTLSAALEMCKYAMIDEDGPLRGVDSKVIDALESALTPDLAALVERQKAMERVVEAGRAFLRFFDSNEDVSVEPKKLLVYIDASSESSEEFRQALAALSALERKA